MHEQNFAQTEAPAEQQIEMPRVASPRRRVASLILKLSICLVSLLTLLGGSLGEHFYQPEAFNDALSAPLAQQSKPAPKATPTTADKLDRPVSEPYTGDLSIFEDPKRAERLQIERVMDLLQLKEGTSVADIGAGSGWFTVRAARRVGSAGAVYAVEINQDYLKHIAARAAQEKLPNIRPVLGREDDPLLPPASVDAVLLLKTYHEIAQPVRLLRNLRPALRKGALVGIIDRNGKGDDHGLDVGVVLKEFERAGYERVAQYDFVKPDKMDYFLIFRARS